MSRRWLITLAALIVLPWLVVAGIYTWGSRQRVQAPAPDPEVGSERPAGPGPWGHLSLTPIVISPPLEYVAEDWGGLFASPDLWYFPGTSGEVLEAFLASTGLGPDTVARLRAEARPAPEIQGLVIRPDPELVRALDPQVRARLYFQLAKSPLNIDQAQAFRFAGTSVDAWLGGSLIAPETRRLLEPLIYRDDAFLYFADVHWIRSQVRDVEELRRVAKVLLRQSTVLARLTVSSSEEVDDLAEYWGRGGRRTDLRPLLESIAGAANDQAIDVVHLLPAFARNHLYRYPKITTADLDRPLLSNCLWSALNFFGQEPDNRFLDVNTAVTSLRQGYYVVQSGFQLGDIVAFLDEEGDLFHVAVYLADNLHFSKNGMSPMAPWAVQTVDQIKAYYRLRSANPRLIYHRRNDF